MVATGGGGGGGRRRREEEGGGEASPLQYSSISVRIKD
jgi:hypothetical protein